MDRREYRINLRAAAWVQEIHRTQFHYDRKRQDKFRAWLEHSGTHRDAFQHALNAWDRLKQLGPTHTAALTSLDARRALRRTQPDSRPRWGVAAALVLSVLVMPMLAGRIAATVSVYGTAVGESRTIPFGDGTIVNLNSATRIAVQSYGRFREVHLLEGEAFFSVAPGAGRFLRVFAPFAIAAADGAQFDVSRSTGHMAIVTVKGVAAIVAIDPYRLTDIDFGDSDSLYKATIVVRPSDAIRIGYAGGMQVRRNTVSDTQLERLVAWREQPLYFGRESSEAKWSDSEKMVIADSVIASQSASGHAVVTLPIIYAIAIEHELTWLMIESDVDTKHRSRPMYGKEPSGSADPPRGLSP
jgi:ferric-dicitrate binding protein FerR (iron transport regulator)